MSDDPSKKTAPVVALQSRIHNEDLTEHILVGKSDFSKVFVNTEIDHAALDAIAEAPTIFRLTSIERTDVCSVWNGFKQFWEENDEHFRERLKQELELEP